MHPKKWTCADEGREDEAGTGWGETPEEAARDYAEGRAIVVMVSVDDTWQRVDLRGGGERC